MIKKSKSSRLWAEYIQTSFFPPNIYQEYKPCSKFNIQQDSKKIRTDHQSRKLQARKLKDWSKEKDRLESKGIFRTPP